MQQAERGHIQIYAASSESRRRHQKHSAIFRALLEALLMLREKEMESVMDVLNCHNVSVYRDSLSLSHTHTHSNLQHTSCARLLLQIEGGAGGVGWGGSHTLSGTPIGREKSCSSLHHRLHNGLERQNLTSAFLPPVRGIKNKTALFPPI